MNSKHMLTGLGVIALAITTGCVDINGPSGTNKSVNGNDHFCKYDVDTPFPGPGGGMVGVICLPACTTVANCAPGLPSVTIDPGTGGHNIATGLTLMGCVPVCVGNPASGSVH